MARGNAAETFKTLMAGARPPRPVGPTLPEPLTLGRQLKKDFPPETYTPKPVLQGPVPQGFKVVGRTRGGI